MSNLITTVTTQPYQMSNGRKKMMGTMTVHLNFGVEEMDSLDAHGLLSSITSHPGPVTNVSALTGRYTRFPCIITTELCTEVDLISFFANILIIYCSPFTSVLAPHPSVTEIVTFCNNPECFLNFLGSTSSRHTELFKGLGHHVKNKKTDKSSCRFC